VVDHPLTPSLGYGERGTSSAAEFRADKRDEKDRYGEKRRCYVDTAQASELGGMTKGRCRRLGKVGWLTEARKRTNRAPSDESEELLQDNGNGQISLIYLVAGVWE
jgi:hypothetical protein